MLDLLYMEILAFFDCCPSFYCLYGKTKKYEKLEYFAQNASCIGNFAG